MYSQCDEEGRSYYLLDEIVDHRQDEKAVQFSDRFYPGTDKIKRTTKGWDLLVNWKDGTSDWIPLKDLKESNPIEVAEYAVANKLTE